MIGVVSSLRRMLVGLVVSCPLALTLTAADQEAVHYWNGTQRVDLVLALDELQVEAQAAQAGRAERALGGQAASERVAARALGEVRTHLRFTAHDRAALDAQARALSALPGVVGVDAVLYPATAVRSERTRGALTHRLSLRVRPGQDVAALAQRRGLRVVETVAYSPDTYILEAIDGSAAAALEAADALYELDGAVFATPLIARRHVPYGVPTDPLFSSQWHLQNLGAGQVTGGVAGNDINVVPIWDFTGGHHLGAGINIAVVDDGTELTHEDLAANVRTDIDLNLNGAPGNSDDPSPGVDDLHGTWTAGVAAARDGNGKGGVGVAPRASIVAVRLIAAATTDSQDAQAMGHQAAATVAPADRVHVSSNSWGPGEGDLLGPGPLMQAAMLNATNVGRGGKGVVYVFAAGNNHTDGDDAGYDGIASNRLVIAVGATNEAGVRAYYSQSGCCLLVNAPGGEGFSNAPSSGIVTTDRTGLTGTTASPDEDFPGNYTTIPEGLQGTSFATPMVAGVAALIIEANPNLSWREVQHALVRSAVRNDPADAGWAAVADNGYGVPGRSFNHAYGYGRVDATAAVNLVAPSTWVPAPPEATPVTASETLSPALTIPDNDPTGIQRTLTIAAPAGFRTEHVEFTVNVTHPSRGDLHFRLVSPRGMVSDLPARLGLDQEANYNWTFTTAADWGEDPSGTWTLKIDDEAAQDVGTLNSWSLAVHGYVGYSAPTMATLVPASAPEGAADTAITVTGAGFIAGVSQVQWNGVALATTFVSATQLSAVVPAADLAAAGTAIVRVANLDFDGGAAHASAGSPFIVSGPQVVAVSSPLADGTYTALGFSVPVTVSFSVPVVVTGTPTLALNTAPSHSASYLSGSGTATLTFAYTIADGDFSSRLDETGAGIALAGGTIKDNAGFDAVTAVPAPGAAGALGANKAIAIAGNLALITDVTSSAQDGIYHRGAAIPIQVTFSKPVTVTGTPLLALATLPVPAQAVYASGSGSDTLTFTLVVGAGQSTPDLDASSTTALSLDGATLAGPGGSHVLANLPAPGAAHSLGANKNLILDSPPDSSSGRKCGFGHLFGFMALLSLAGLRMRGARRTPVRG